ncbi:hypothetical protein P4O66_002509 [Electrophorus voltai]|uniref:Uncharacterized protein n=1 Tax=Electrophorus voltai TaxID=2609070 RepID=A0AAD8YZS3_9TELE|nr:hypothetical protein P4O66_002509 [Electrophorus voltai]
MRKATSKWVFLPFSPCKAASQVVQTESQGAMLMAWYGPASPLWLPSAQASVESVASVDGCWRHVGLGLPCPSQTIDGALCEEGEACPSQGGNIELRGDEIDVMSSGTFPATEEKRSDSIFHCPSYRAWGECSWKILGGPECSPGEDSTESYRPVTDYESWYQGDQYQGPDSAGSYYPYWDHWEYHRVHDRSKCQTDTSLRSENTDVSFRSDSEVYQKENPVMEVEEALHRDSPLEMDTQSSGTQAEAIQRQGTDAHSHDGPIS